MDISFYHLTRTTIEKTLPKLLEKILDSGLKAVVRTKDNYEKKLLDESLWTYNPNSFIPHGTSENDFPEEQFVFLTENLENPNQATILIDLSSQQVDDFLKFTKYLYVFDANEENSLEKARNHWKAYQQQGHNLRYFFQEENGNWVEQKKAG